MMLPLVTSPKVLWGCAVWTVLQRWAGENRYAFSFTDGLRKGQTRRQLPNGPPLARGILRATAFPGYRCVRASTHLVTSCRLPPVSTQHQLVLGNVLTCQR